MSNEDLGHLTWREKAAAVKRVAEYNPKFIVLILGIGMLSAVFEGIGLTFIVPIVELVRAENPAAEAEGLSQAFLTVYQTLNVPFTLGYVVGGVCLVMTLRFTTRFLTFWLRDILRIRYRRHLQLRALDATLNAPMSYFDREGSDDILNAIITEATKSADLIKRFVKLLQVLFLTVVYLAISFYIAPYLTLFSLVVLGGFTAIAFTIVETGFSLGGKMAEANERKQEAAQAATLGIRDIRIFGLEGKLYEDFRDAVDQFTGAKIAARRNDQAIKNFYNLAVAVSVFVLIYVALRFANLSFSSLALFLFAMFQLGPRASSLNRNYYKVDENLPHLVRNQRFVEDLERNVDTSEATESVPETVRNVEFDDVWFSYDEDEDVLRGIDFEVEKGEFVAFVGQSGAGKSTIVSLLARFYDLDRGRMLANGRRIDEMDAGEWRERIAIVRQNPYIFDDTLRFNLTIGNRDATQREIDRACEIACVDEFLDELSDGYDTELGDRGVQLSGGQKQRVALARALLKDDADLLILDEATSDLDSNLEKQVQREIESMDRDYAIVTIAHQLSTVQNADRIYTLENGRITESGPHAELVEREGKYAELHAIQTQQ